MSDTYFCGITFVVTSRHLNANLENNVFTPHRKTATGFPSPADDHLERALDLNELLVKRPHSTFFMKVENERMKPVINKGDIIIVDRAIRPRSGHVVIASVHDDLVIGALKLDKECLKLIPYNKDFSIDQYSYSENIEIWGVVLHAITELRI